MQLDSIKKDIFNLSDKKLIEYFNMLRNIRLDLTLKTYRKNKPKTKKEVKLSKRKATKKCKINTTKSLRQLKSINIDQLTPEQKTILYNQLKGIT